MNSRYWGKTVIKLLNLTNNVYKCTISATMTGKLKKVESKLVYGDRWSCGHASRARQWTQDMLARKQLSLQDTLTRE